MRLAIHHMTHYRFAGPIAYGVQRLRLFPKTAHGQSVVAWDMTVTGGVVAARLADHFQNEVALIVADRDASEVTITCDGLVDTADTVGIVGPHRGPAPLWLYCQPTALTRPGREIRRLAQHRDAAGNALDRLHALAADVRAAIAFTVGATDAATPAEAALAAGRGVCQDHAQVFIAAARLIGFPARYVSGYLKLDQTVAQDAAHAWAEVLVPDLGWVGFDVANGISPDARYVRVATGRDYREAAPVAGVSIGTGAHDLTVALRVEQQ